MEKEEYASKDFPNPMDEIQVLACRVFASY